MKKSPRATLHTLIGEREKAEKRKLYGNPKAEKDFSEASKKVDEFLKLHPELEEEVDVIEEHFMKKLYN